MERVNLGVLVVEQSNGEVAVQLFENPSAMMESFNNLDDPKVSRATLLEIEWHGTEVTVSGSLPANYEKRARAWELGKGPIPDPEYRLKNHPFKTFLRKFFRL